MCFYREWKKIYGTAGLCKKKKLAGNQLYECGALVSTRACPLWCGRAYQKRGASLVPETDRRHFHKLELGRPRRRHLPLSIKREGAVNIWPCKREGAVNIYPRVRRAPRRPRVSWRAPLHLDSRGRPKIQVRARHLFG